MTLAMQPIKAIKPEDGHQTVRRAALLYQHALRFDGSDEERRQILARAMLVIPIPASFKSETLRFRRSKFGDGGEMHTLRDGKHIIWRQWTPSDKLKHQAKQKRDAAKA